MPRIITLSLVMLPCLCAACTGADQLGEPWGSPVQYSTALPDTPYPPRDLAMFDGVNGRVLMWADLMRLVRRTEVIVVDDTPTDAGSVAVRNALLDDVQAAFKPTATIDCGQGGVACAESVSDAFKAGSRRVVVRASNTDSLSGLSSAIRTGSPTTTVTTVALVPSAARFLREGDRERADVVVYTAPTRTVAPSDLPAPSAPAR